MLVSKNKAVEVGKRLGLDWKVYSSKEFTIGMNEELEHRDVTKGNLFLTGKIVKAHLDEVPDYYTRLKKAGLIRG